MAQWLRSFSRTLAPGNLAGRLVGAHVCSRAGGGRSERGSEASEECLRSFPAIWLLPWEEEGEGREHVKVGG